MIPTPQKTRRQSGFTLIEMLVVIAIMAILASLFLVGTRTIARKQREERTTSEMHLIETAINNYKTKFGYYPPGILTNDYRINSLYYELAGTAVLSPTTIKVNKGNQSIPTSTVQALFGKDLFANTAEPNEPDTLYSAFKSGSLPPVKEVLLSGGHKLHVMVVTAEGKDELNSTETPSKKVNCWYYNSVNPTHNAGAYDLWAEFVDGKNTVVIKNWK